MLSLGVNEVSLKATEILDDSTRLFATSVFVQLKRFVFSENTGREVRF
jgi:hypothetical protein